MELLLAWSRVIDEHYVRHGAIVIDAAKSPELVVDEMLRALRTAK